MEKTEKIQYEAPVANLVDFENEYLFADVQYMGRALIGDSVTEAPE